jgi:predicted CopG family antitoxin
MHNGLHYTAWEQGETHVGKTNRTISIDDDLWNEFCSIVVKKHGNRYISNALEELLKEYIKKNGGT